MQFLVANVTPFDARGKVDLGRLRAHILWLMAKGVEGFVPTSDAGEFLYLSDREREAVQRTVLDAARGLPVYPYIWDANPSTARYLADAAAAEGASGIFVPPPLHYDLEDEAITAWYRSVAEHSSLPVLAHHNPDRMLTQVRQSVYSRLRDDGVIGGMLDSSSDIYRLQRLCDSDPGAMYASGDILLADAAQIRCLGGFVSTIGNLWPSFCRRVYQERQDELRDALRDRVNILRRAGGIRAIKAELSMGHRAPLIAPPQARMERVPARER